MLELSSHKEALSRICDEWNKAEDAIKGAESVCSGAPVPAVDMLRCAGGRVVRAVVAITRGASPTDVDGLLIDAEFDCYRAQRSAIGAATTQMVENLRSMQERLGHDVVLRVFYEFAAFWRELSRIHGRVDVSRGDMDDREATLTAISDADFPALLTRYQELMASEPLMREVARRERRRVVISYGTAGLGIVIGIVGVVLTIIPMLKP
ncbi:MAG: hypothetical protein H7840_05290 [Alphaproteobacteria bacterium]